MPDKIIISESVRTAFGPFARRLVYCLAGILFIMGSDAAAGEPPATAPPGDAGISVASSPRLVTSGWSYRWGDSPVDDRGRPLWALLKKCPADWKSYTPPRSPPGREGRKYLWLCLEPSLTAAPDPVLYLGGVWLVFDAYREGCRIYRFGNPDPPGDDFFQGFPQHIISLEADNPQSPLFLRVHSQVSIGIGLEGKAILGSRADIIRMILLEDADRPIVGFFIFTMGLLSLFIFLSRRRFRETIFIAFGLFAGATGMSYLFVSKQVRLLTSLPQFHFFAGYLTSLIWPLGLLLFFEILFSPQKFFRIRLLYRIQQVFAALNILFFPLIFSFPKGAIIYPLLVYMNLILLSGYTVVLIYVSIRTLLQGSVQARIVAVAFIVLGLFGFVEVLTSVRILKGWSSIYHRGVLSFVLILGYGLERYVSETQADFLRQKEELNLMERDLEESRFKIMQNRINPHFFLNALSVIQALIRGRSLKLAEEAILLLTEQYWFLMDRAQHSLIPFVEEWDFCSNYLKLQKIRYGDTVNFNMDNLVGPDGLRIPPLTVQTLVENAFKHGLRESPGNGFISVAVKKDRQSVQVEVLDNGAGLKGRRSLIVRPGQEEIRTDRTLHDIINRLHFFYEKAELILENRSDGSGVRALLTFGGFIHESPE